ncbi:MAG: IclR family transcriptional regulator [Marmoricola sp.]
MSESLRKALRILDALRESDTTLSARDLAAHMGMPKSTAQRLLQTLEESGMAVQDPVTRKYGLGPHTLSLGMAYRDRLDLRNIALPPMRVLRDATDETIGLSVALGDQRMFIEEVQSQSELRAHSELGQPYPIWTGAPGRVLLADMSDREVARILDAAGPPAWEHINLPTREALLEVLAEIREHGHDHARDETIRGISAVAVPVHDADRRAAAALSVSGPTARMTPEVMEEVVQSATVAASAIELALGGSPAAPRMRLGRSSLVAEASTSAAGGRRTREEH